MQPPPVPHTSLSNNSCQMKKWIYYNWRKCNKIESAPWHSYRVWCHYKITTRTMPLANSLETPWRLNHPGVIVVRTNNQQLLIQCLCAAPDQWIISLLCVSPHLFELPSPFSSHSRMVVHQYAFIATVALCMVIIWRKRNSSRLV